MRCIPHKSEIVKETDGNLTWYKEKTDTRQSFNDQPSFRNSSYNYLKWHKNDSLMKIFF